MLKYRIRKGNSQTDTRELQIISRIDPQQEGAILKLTEFLAKDIYEIKNGSMLKGVCSVSVSNDEGLEPRKFDYLTDIEVYGASKIDNTFTVEFADYMELDITGIHSEVRTNGIQFNGNDWEIFSVPLEWVEENGAEPIATECAAVGALTIPECDGERHPEALEYRVFYYENQCWKSIILSTDEVNAYSSGGKLSFEDFHKFDKTEKTKIELDKNKTYYTSGTYIVFSFSPTHYFSSSNEVVNSDENEGKYMPEYTEFYREVIENIEYPSIKLSYSDDGSSTDIECHVDNYSDLSFNYDSINKDLKDFLVNYAFNGDILSGEGNSGYFRITRDNILNGSTNSYLRLLYDVPLVSIQIPISQKFETDMLHYDALTTNFVDAEIEKAINKTIDLEKDVYIPVIANPSNGSQYEECFKIIFNLHFRKHRNRKNGDEWTCDRDDFWNGTRVSDDGKVNLDGEVFQYEDSDGKKNKHDYFSYFKSLGNNQGKEYQSDTLAYLGFTNDDVKYQKSKLKKSFLRLSFYDSDNVANQNLLHTSTIFLDGGNLFAKYIRNIETGDLYEVIEGFDDSENSGIVYSANEVIDGNIYRNLIPENQAKCRIYGNPMAVTGTSATDEDTFTVYDKNGVRVNREPMRLYPMDDNGEWITSFEELRLSSQIVVSDKYSSNKSSEGFYFYNFKGNDNGVIPTEMYMRVEFNHAGYGRTIPFMMPYITENEYNGSGIYAGRDNRIKTFDDICYDWSETSDKQDYGYGTVKYMKYAYIKWKYRYDKETQRHIYYLDPGIYGTGATSDNGHFNNIILNLYEGKIR